MAMNDRSTATHPGRMSSMRKTAFVAGLLYLITYLAIPTHRPLRPRAERSGLHRELGQRHAACSGAPSSS